MLLTATDEANKQHAEFLAQKFLNQNLHEYIFEDVTYKENCPVKIIESSHKLLVAKLLAEKGLNVTIYDEMQVIDLVRNEYGDLFNYVVK